MLHSSAVDVGTIRADHDEMNFFSKSIRIQATSVIAVIAEVKTSIESVRFFLTGFLTFQRSYHI